MGERSGTVNNIFKVTEKKEFCLGKSPGEAKRHGSDL